MSETNERFIPNDIQIDSIDVQIDTALSQVSNDYADVDLDDDKVIFSNEAYVTNQSYPDEAGDEETIIINEVYVTEQFNPDCVDAESSYAEVIITQDLFEQREDIIYLQGIPVPVMVYPFWEIVATEENGRASFVIFVDPECFDITQNVNFFRMDSISFPPSGESRVFMEVTQLTDINVDEAISLLKLEHDFDFYELSSYTYATEYFPFYSFSFSYGYGWDAKTTRIFVRDNTQGGVFVITVQCDIQNAGFLQLTRHYVSTLVILDEYSVKRQKY